MPEFQALKAIRDAYSAHTGVQRAKVKHAALIRIALTTAARLARRHEIRAYPIQIPAGFPVTRFSFKFSVPDEYALQEIADAFRHQLGGKQVHPPRSELIRIAILEAAKLAERGELFAPVAGPSNGAPVFEAD
jgi:hypothetical protein